MSPKYKLDRAKNSQVEHSLFYRMNYKFFYYVCFDLDCGYAGNFAICSERMAFENSRFFRVPTTVIIISFVFFVKVFFYISCSTNLSFGVCLK
jgi:hypothetical protein